MNDKAKIAALEAELQRIADTAAGTIDIQSIVSHHDQHGRVRLSWAGLSATFTPNEARDFALRLNQAAEAAESDAFLFRFIRDEWDLSEETAGRSLAAFREYREARRRADYLPPKEERKP